MICFCRKHLAFGFERLPSETIVILMHWRPILMHWWPMSISFKGVNFPNSAFMYAVFFYSRYDVFYRDL